jgi:hypothetical protein
MQTDVKALASIVFYLPNKLKVQRTKVENLQRNLKNPLNNVYKINNDNRKAFDFELERNNKYNLMVEGLGLIMIKGLSKLTVNTFTNVKLTLLKDSII